MNGLHVDSGNVGIDRAPDVAPDEPLRIDLISPAILRWRLLLACSVIGVVVALCLHAIATPRFTASVVLAPAANSRGGNAMDSLGLSGLAGLAGATLGRSGEVPPLDRFRFLLDSVRLAEWQVREAGQLERLFPERWDAESRQWKAPTGMLQAGKAIVRPWFDLPAWRAPDKFSVVNTYEENLRQIEIGDTQLLRLTYSDTDPERARAILRDIVEDADDIVKRDALERASLQAKYLRSRLETETILDYRETLVKLLSEQEQTLMLANTSLPFAVDIIEGYQVEDVPTSKKPGSAAALGLLAGFALGYVWALLLHNFGRIPISPSLKRLEA